MDVEEIVLKERMSIKSGKYNSPRLSEIYFRYKRIKSICVLLLLVILPCETFSQKNQKLKIIGESIKASDLERHLNVIAGKEMEGRGVATEGERRAAAYIMNNFKALGLKPGNNGNYLMPFPLFRDTLINAGIEVNNKKFRWNEDFIADVGCHTSTLLFDEAVFVGWNKPEASEKLDLVGRLVITADDPALYFALNNGAAVILMVRSDFKPKENINLRYVYLEQNFRHTTSVVFYTISEEIASLIMNNTFLSEADSLQKSTFKPTVYKANIKLELHKQTDKVISNNVVGFVEGTDRSDEYLVLTAHYDHLGKRPNGIVFYGADDDASGVVSILEIAEAFVKARNAGYGPRRSVVFMTVSGEERGLWGSGYYNKNPLFPFEKTSVNLNIDMVGRIDPHYKGDSLNYIYTIGENMLSSDLQKITDSVNKEYSKLQIDRKYNDPKDPNRFYYRSDHYNFAKKGVPIIFYFNGIHGDYHKPSDTPDKINYELMTKRVRLIFYTAWHIANRDNMLSRDVPLMDQ